MDDFKDKAILITGASTGIGVFLYFASERLSGYVTGQILEVNGGQFMP